jgi:hypothetical protein
MTKAGALAASGDVNALDLARELASAVDRRWAYEALEAVAVRLGIDNVATDAQAMAVRSTDAPGPSDDELDETEQT